MGEAPTAAGGSPRNAGWARVWVGGGAALQTAHKRCPCRRGPGAGRGQGMGRACNAPHWATCTPLSG